MWVVGLLFARWYAGMLGHEQRKAWVWVFVFVFVCVCAVAHVFTISAESHAYDSHPHVRICVRVLGRGQRGGVADGVSVAKTACHLNLGRTCFVRVYVWFYSVFGFGFWFVLAWSACTSVICVRNGVFYVCGGVGRAHRLNPIARNCL